jgi:hypothetical protein
MFFTQIEIKTKKNAKCFQNSPRHHRKQTTVDFETRDKVQMENWTRS